MSANSKAKTLKDRPAITPSASSLVAVASPSDGSLQKATAANVVIGGLGTITADAMLVSNSAGTGLTWGAPVTFLNLSGITGTATVPSYLSTLTGISGVNSSSTLSFLNLSNVTHVINATNGFNFTSNSSLGGVNSPNLCQINGNLRISACTGLTYWDASLLKVIHGNVNIINNVLNSSINFNSVKHIYGSFTFTGNSTLQGFPLSPPFQDLEIVTGSFNATNNSFTSNSVDYILYMLGRMDGTNGRCLYGSGLTVNVGGNNAAPGTSIVYGGKTGMEWVNVLVARGATVTHN